VNQLPAMLRRTRRGCRLAVLSRPAEVLDQGLQFGPFEVNRSQAAVGAGYATPATYAAQLTAMGDRLRETEAIRPVATQTSPACRITSAHPGRAAIPESRGVSVREDPIAVCD
jgi:hypothetical protein